MRRIPRHHSGIPALPSCTVSQILQGFSYDTAALQQGLVMGAHMAQEATEAATAARTADKWAQASVSVTPLDELLLQIGPSC